MLNPDLVTLLLQIANFLVILWIANLLVFKPLRKTLNARNKAISDTLENARDQETEAIRLRDAWQGRMEAIEQEREQIVQDAVADANEKRADIFEDSRRRLDRLTEEMREDMRRQRNEMVVQRYDEILDTILDLSGNVVQSVTTRRTHDDLVTNFCASIYQLPQTNIDEYRRLMAGRVPTAFVTTPVTLSADQTKTLSDTLSSLIDRRVELQVTVDPTLIAGLQVRLADKLIDNSIRQQLQRIRENVLEDLVGRMGGTTGVTVGGTSAE